MPILNGEWLAWDAWGPCWPGCAWGKEEASVPLQLHVSEQGPGPGLQEIISPEATGAGLTRGHRVLGGGGGQYCRNSCLPLPNFSASYKYSQHSLCSPPWLAEGPQMARFPWSLPRKSVRLMSPSPPPTCICRFWAFWILFQPQGREDVGGPQQGLPAPAGWWHWET